jgi:Tfp pilus assembly pilus retraction ATPase PilT
MFSPSDYSRIYKRLSWTLNGIVTQWLVPGKTGGRTLACEILTNVDAISNLLRNGEIHQIRTLLDNSISNELVSLKRYTELLLDQRGLV